jgi:GT2 family glycosyltransferase
MAFAYNLLVRAVFGLPVRDVNFAFKLFRRSLLERIALTSEGSFIDVELLLRARDAGAHVIQMGVDYFPRRHGASKLSSPAVVRDILREMARYRSQRR